jgi:hypothetical protein
MGAMQGWWYIEGPCVGVSLYKQVKDDSWHFPYTEEPCRQSILRKTVLLRSLQMPSRICKVYACMNECKLGMFRERVAEE